MYKTRPIPISDEYSQTASRKEITPKYDMHDSALLVGCFGFSATLTAMVIYHGGR